MNNTPGVESVLLNDGSDGKGRLVQHIPYIGNRWYDLVVSNKLRGVADVVGCRLGYSVVFKIVGTDETFKVDDAFTTSGDRRSLASDEMIQRVEEFVGRSGLVIIKS